MLKSIISAIARGWENVKYIVTKLNKDGVALYWEKLMRSPSQIDDNRREAKADLNASRKR